MACRGGESIEGDAVKLSAYPACLRLATNTPSGRPPNLQQRISTKISTFVIIIFHLFYFSRGKFE